MNQKPRLHAIVSFLIGNLSTCEKNMLIEWLTNSPENITRLIHIHEILENAGLIRNSPPFDMEKEWQRLSKNIEEFRNKSKDESYNNK